MGSIGVALFVYKRPNKTWEVLQGIKKSSIKKLYIFQDGLKHKEDEKEWIKVNKLIKQIDFLEKEIYISDCNKGLAQSIIDGINYIFESHDKVIALEDDCLIGKYYYEYMEKCFELYENEKKVMCISGNSWPISIPKEYMYDVYFSYRMDSIGWGTWKDRWSLYKRDFNLLSFIKRDRLKNQILEKSGNDIIPMLQAQKEGDTDSWAIFWQLVQINNMGLCVQPRASLAIDIGRDTTGTNTKFKIDRYDTTLYDEILDNIKLPQNPIIDNKIIEDIVAVCSNYSIDYISKIYVDLLKKWINYLYNDMKLKSYFKNLNIDSIYIYGTGDFAKLVIKDLKDDIKINGFIVTTKKEEIFEGYGVFSYKEINLNNTCVLITPVYDFKYIRTVLFRYYNNINLINLQDIFI